MSTNFEDIILLIAENNDSERKRLFDILSKYFKFILEAVDGKIAYELYKKNKVDIIISNDDMPNVNGLELLKLIRLSDSNIGFIITSREMDASKFLELIDLNINGFLSKPISQGKLLQKIDILSERVLIEKKLLLKGSEVKNYISAVDKVALIYKMKANGSITYMNKSMLLISGYQESDIKDLKFKDIIHPNIPSKYIEQTWTEIKNGKHWRGNTKFLSKSNESFYLNNSIFKIEQDGNEEFITISFLTTKENLEKRDFQKKVILNIKEANKKEQILLTDNLKLKEELIGCKRIISNYSQSSIDELNVKIYKQDSQLCKYERDIVSLNDKYSKMLITKRNEVEYHINSIQSYKLKIDKLIKDIKNLEEEVNVSHEKIKYLLHDIEKKNKSIIDLKFIIG